MSFNYNRTGMRQYNTLLCASATLKAAQFVDDWKCYTSVVVPKWPHWHSREKLHLMRMRCLLGYS